jgi:hypothetical protein
VIVAISVTNDRVDIAAGPAKQTPRAQVEHEAIVTASVVMPDPPIINR